MSIFSRILVGTDGSDGARVAVDFAARLAREHRGALILCNSVNWVPIAADASSAGAILDPKLIDDLRATGEAALEEAAVRAKAAGVEPVCHALEGEPGQRIIELADSERCTLIVMATHGRVGLEHLFLGSTTESVLRRSTIPVLTLRAGTRVPANGRCIERIVVGLDDSEPSDAALATVMDFPPEDRASVLLCSAAGSAVVLGGDGYYSAVMDELRKAAEQVVDAAVSSAREHGVKALGRVEDGEVAPALIAVAENERADLIVLGSHGRRGLRRLFLGSIAEQIVQSAPVPVLVVRTAKTPSSKLLVA